MAVALQRSAIDVYEQTKVWQRSHQEVLELLATMANFSGRVGRLTSEAGGDGLGVLGEIEGMRERLVAKHTERCENIMTAVREELRVLATTCQSMDATLDTAHEQYYRLLDSATQTRPDAPPERAAGSVAIEEATRAACQRTETDPSATDYLQWMLEVQRTYRREYNLKEQLLKQLQDYGDAGQVGAVQQAWQAQPFCSRRTDVDADGAVTVSARVLHSLAEAERQQAAATSSAATAHAGD